ncbi:MAG: hypothetical protein U0X76_13400 [Bacteroidia bacterium]|nr:hypothetical protein [Bacteroidia bacterium]
MGKTLKHIYFIIKIKVIQVLNLTKYKIHQMKNQIFIVKPIYSASGGIPETAVVNLNGKEVARTWHIPEMKKELAEIIRSDGKSMKDISVYYEYHRAAGSPQAIDGHGEFLKVKEVYENQGMVLMKERKEVVIEGIKLRRLIFRYIDNNKETEDHFGLLSGYVQASCEHVMYMKRF